MRFTVTARVRHVRSSRSIRRRFRSELLESEFFGHERGAFTGAQSQRRGRFEQAEGGTLFLDEIGDMPQELQTRLLRVLSDANFYRVGGHQPIKANVRVIAATHQDLDTRVRQGLFREDLFHRLNVIRLRLPSLRERREDIPLLAKHFLQKSARDLNVEPKRLSEAALKYLQAQDWPGNVSQLENVCHWLTVMSPSVNVEVNDLPGELRAGKQAQRSAELDHGARARSGVAAEPRRTGDHRRAHTSVREGAHPACARTHRRTPHRGRAPSGPRPQYAHAQNPGA